MERINWGQIIPIALSTIVSIVAVLVPAYQAKVNARVKLSELYFKAQFEAYMELMNALAEQEADIPESTVRDFRRLISAGQKAQLISISLNSEVISNYCAVFMNYLTASDVGTVPPALEKEFQEAKLMLITMLQKELLRFDKGKRKLNKQLKRINREGN